VRANIETTRPFYTELQRIVDTARKSPGNPIILEAYGPGAYEAVFSLSTYLSALGAKNPVSVRLHRAANLHGTLYDDLQQTLADMENSSKVLALTPLRDNLANRSGGCISVGILGLPDEACSGFKVNVQ